MSNLEHNDIYPTRSPPVSPAISPTITAPPQSGGFTTFDPSLTISLASLSRANSLARMGSEMLPMSHPLSSHPFPHSPYPPATPSAPQSPNHKRIPPPINTSFSTTHTPMPTPTVNTFVTAGGNNVNNMTSTNNGNTANPMDLRELSIVRWKAGHAFFIFGALLMVLGFCIGLMHSPVTTCKVPYMAYSYYDNYVPYADIECTTHANGWYVGAPLFAIGALCVGFAWYYSWVKVQEMKMASKYHVAMV